MYVCLCYGITERTIEAEIQQGAKSVMDLVKNTGAGGSCGQCIAQMKIMLDNAKPKSLFAFPLNVFNTTTKPTTT